MSLDRISSAFVLAAGRGERLRPLTDSTPKPLIPLHGKPMIEYCLEALAQLKLKKVVLNAWHLSDQIEAYVKAKKMSFPFELQVSKEQELLGTGGGLKKALPLLGEPPFLMMNGDSFWRGDLSAFVEAVSGHSEMGFESSWALTEPRESQTKIGRRGDEIVSIGSLWAHSEVEPQAFGCFSGIQMVHQIESDQLPEKGCILRDYWLARLGAGGRLAAEQGFLKFWEDLGTPERLKSVENQMP